MREQITRGVAGGHGWEDTYGFWIWCRCGWGHFSWFDSMNERALRKHLEMHR